MMILDKVQHAVDEAAFSRTLLRSCSKKNLYAPGSITQILARNPDLLREWEENICDLTSKANYFDWMGRIELIKNGYGLELISVPVEDWELNDIDDVDEYMLQLSRIKH